MTDRLLVALETLPVEWPGVPDVAVPAGQRRRSPLVPRLAVAAVTLLVGSVGLVTPVREAVAEWLGIGVVRVELVDTLPDALGNELDLGAPVGIDAVDLDWPPPLGPPDGAFDRDGEVSLVWAPSDTVPEVAGTGMGAILTRFDGSLDPGVEKSLGAGATLRVVMIDGERAYWIEGEPHSFVYLDATGHPVESSARLAGNALIWQGAGFTWRFESALELVTVEALFG